MNGDEFRVAGKQMIDYIADYLENIRERPVLSSVEPFYIRSLVPDSPPEQPECWNDVFGDVEKVIMDGVSFLRFLKFEKFEKLKNFLKSNPLDDTLAFA